MCVPYIIPDSPPPRKRPKKGGSVAKSDSRRGSRVQPAYIEISPRLTYVASPKPDRSPVPSKIISAPQKPHQPQEADSLNGSAAGEQASGQKEGRMTEKDKQSAEAAPQSAPSGQSAAPSPEPPPPAPTPPMQPQHKQPSPPSTDSLPSNHKLPPPPAPAPFKPQRKPSAPPPRDPRPRSPRSPHSYTRRPPPHYQANHRSRSLSSDSSISRRSFERLKRNVHVLWEKIRALERWKEAREEDERRRRRGWELGYHRRERSLVREMEQRPRVCEREGRRLGGEERWDWEGGGLGRR